MIWRLAKLDVALLSRSRASLLALGLFAVLGALAIASGLDWRARYTASIDADRTKVDEAKAQLIAVYDGLEDGTTTPTNRRLPASEWPDGPYIPDPRDPYVEGFYHERLAALPPGALLHLAVGASELSPNRQILHTVPLANLARPGELSEATNPSALAAGRLDLLAILIYLTPLVLIALLYDATARERESGISFLVMSLGATRRSLLIARGVVRGGAATAVMLALVGAGSALTAAPVGVTAAFALGSALYMAFWVGLCLAVASTRASGVGAAAVLAGLWVGITLLSPSLMERALRPDGLLAPRALADAEVRAVQREWSREGREQARVSHVGERFWDIDVAELPACARYDGPLLDWSVRWLMDEAYVRAIAAGQSAESRFDAALDRAGWISPPLAFRRSMEVIAESDPARNRHFETAVVDFHQSLKERGVQHWLNCDPIGREDFERAPEFAWREPERNPATLASGFGGVGVFAAVAFVFALRRPGGRQL